MYKLLILNLCFGLIGQHLFAQINDLKSLLNVENRIDSIYGLDQLLYNGKQNAYVKPKIIGGNQFLFSEDFTKGKIIINGISYSQLSINYDIFNQELLLKYIDNISSEKKIVVSKAWLNGFELNGKLFKQISTVEFPERFYQVIGNDSIQMLVFYKKEIVLSGVSGTPSYNFSEPIKTHFIKIGNRVVEYNRRSFALLFPPSKQYLIKKYIRQNRIKIKKASDESILKLITFCNNL